MYPSCNVKTENSFGAPPMQDNFTLGFAEGKK